MKSVTPMLRSALTAAILSGAAGTAAPALAADDLLVLQTGAFDLTDDTTAEFGAAWRPAVQYWLLQPHAGALVTTDGTVYGYAGVLLDVPVWNSGLYLTPSVAVGLYGNGDDEHDLGGPVEFRSGVDLMYRFDSGWRAGIGFYHISNAGLYDDNPGTQSLLFSVAVPLPSF